MNFHLGQNPLLPWSIDQAAVIYLPPGATAASSRGSSLCAGPCAPPAPGAPALRFWAETLSVPAPGL